jgi:hypothetical protein
VVKAEAAKAKAAKAKAAKAAKAKRLPSILQSILVVDLTHE